MASNTLLSLDGELLVDRVIQCNGDARVLFAGSDGDEMTVKRTYKRFALKLHPDKNSHKEAAQAFQLLQNSFEALLASVTHGQPLPETTASRPPPPPPPSSKQARPNHTSHEYQRSDHERSRHAHPGQKTSSTRNSGPPPPPPPPMNFPGHDSGFGSGPPPPPPPPPPPFSGPFSAPPPPPPPPHEHLFSNDAPSPKPQQQQQQQKQKKSRKADAGENVFFDIPLPPDIFDDIQQDPMWDGRTAPNYAETPASTTRKNTARSGAGTTSSESNEADQFYSEGVERRQDRSTRRSQRAGTESSPHTAKTPLNLDRLSLSTSSSSDSDDGYGVHRASPLASGFAAQARPPPRKPNAQEQANIRQRLEDERKKKIQSARSLAQLFADFGIPEDDDDKDVLLGQRDSSRAPLFSSTTTASNSGASAATTAASPSSPLNGSLNQAKPSMTGLGGNGSEAVCPHCGSAVPVRDVLVAMRCKYCKQYFMPGDHLSSARTPAGRGAAAPSAASTVFSSAPSTRTPASTSAAAKSMRGTGMSSISSAGYKVSRSNGGGKGAGEERCACGKAAKGKCFLCE